MGPSKPFQGAYMAFPCTLLALDVVMILLTRPSQRIPGPTNLAGSMLCQHARPPTVAGVTLVPPLPLES